MIFGRHDLVQDAPISRIDLLVCRNTLMYLNAETQGRDPRALPLRACDADGYLFLGKAEMLLSHADLFVPLDLKRRIFRKVPELGDPRGRLAALAEAGDPSARTQLERQDAHPRGRVRRGPGAR